MRTRKIKLVFFITVLTFFSFNGIVYSVDKRDEMKEYLGKINPILTNIQVTSRNLSQKLLPLEGAIREMHKGIDILETLTPPEFMARQHKMILLAFKKLKMGFYMLTRGDRPLSIRLVRRGRDLLRTAAKDIVEFSKREGLIKEERE
ncbi:hypothetical protein ACFL28_04880 [Candidatus Omnitrophota bacterium]